MKKLPDTPRLTKEWLYNLERCCMEEFIKKETAQDYWNLPDNERAELIHGKLYAMAPPSRIHQKLVSKLNTKIDNYITDKKGHCEVYPAPFAVNLDAEDKTYVEPDLSVICNPEKLTARGCKGAPDFIIEVVSPASRKLDYSTKNALYMEAGVREYWIVDPAKERVTVYYYEEDAAPVIYPFASSVEVNIFPGLCITIADLLN